jgi:hypothetical protein
MNKFNNIIRKSIKTLIEAGIQSPNNPVIKQAVDVIDKAINNNGQVNADSNAKDLANKLFGTSTDDSTNPLHSAFDKIKQNPENPNLEDHEKEAYMAFADKIKPQDQTSSEEKTTDKKTSEQTSSTTPKVSQQPNATQYNPLNQPAS